MADLSPPRDGERGQLLLVAGFVLAVTFVALALILNSAIFTENLATRGESVGGSGPLETRGMMEDGLDNLVGYVNANNNTVLAYPAQNVSAIVPRYDNFTGRHFVVDGQLATVTYVGTTNGTRIAHSDATREFTSNDTVAPQEDWTLIADTAALRDVGFNVSRATLADTSDCPFGECFRVNVSEAVGTDEWGVALSKNATHVIAESYTDSAVIGSCAVAGETVEVNLTDASIGGEKCQALRFARGVSGPYSVTFEHGDEAVGRYSMVASDETIVSASTGPLGVFAIPSSDNSPRATYAAYAVDVRVTFVTAEVAYNTTVRVAPGEPR